MYGSYSHAARDTTEVFGIRIHGLSESKSTLMIFDTHANLKYKYGNRYFWAKGYFADTVGKNEKVIREYIQNQLQEVKLGAELKDTMEMCGAVTLADITRDKVR